MDLALDLLAMDLTNDPDPVRYDGTPPRLERESVLLASLFDITGYLVRTVFADTGDDDAVYYYINDHLGTPQIIIDEVKNIVWRGDYQPFGSVNAVVSDMGNNFRFAGQYYDSETGLHYNYFRYYDPNTGRYFTPDPIGLDGGINLFVYAGLNPIIYSDPWGLAYFALRPLKGFPWIPGVSHNPVDDYLNTEGAHEQLFFEDEKGGNIGFFDDGTLKEEDNPIGYRITRTGYDDALMREAVNNVSLAPYHLLWQPSPFKEKFNCQDWAEAVRRECERLKKEKEQSPCNKD